MRLRWMRRTAASIALIAATCLIALLPLLPASAVPAASSGGAVAASDGHGTISLFWFPPPGAMPAGGWRIVDAASGRVVAARVSADPAAATWTAARTAKDVAQAYAIAALRAAGDPAYARAAGLAYALHGISGAQRYRIEGLDAAGHLARPQLETASVDGSAATPLPPSPQGARGEPVRGGVALFWRAVAASRADPVLAYAVERDGGGKEGVAANAAPIILARAQSGKSPAFFDRSAPLGAQLQYRIYAVDVFGRRGAPARITLYATDVAAVAPVPANAETAPGSVTVKWTPRENVHTAGYVVERSALQGGPYTPLMRQALPPRTSSYIDGTVAPGTAYFYEVRAVDAQGTLGPPSIPVMARVRSTAPPPQPTALRATLQRTRVELVWQGPSAGIAGYQIQRRVGEQGVWETLNQRVTPLERFDDYLGGKSSGVVLYRVTAVGRDDQVSRSSEIASVTLHDDAPPPVPYIDAASGAGGKVTLRVAPGAPATRTQSFLLLRSATPKELGLVIGDPTPAGHPEIVDGFVQPGGVYWYRVVALDAKGNRSEPTRAVAVRVGGAPIPQPPAPTASYAAKPFAQVKIGFAKPPPGLGVVVEYRHAHSGPWTILAGPIRDGNGALDAHPPASGSVEYRIVFEGPNRAEGLPSQPVSVTIP